MSSLSELERRALDAVDPASMVVTLRDFIAIPSVGGTAAEMDAQHWMAQRLERLDLDVDLWPIDLAEAYADPAFPGVEVERLEAWGLVGTTPSYADGPTLALNGHIDVVPSGDLRGWGGTGPWDARIESTADGAVIHGRGSCDMKAGVVASLMAVQALREAGVRLAGPLAVHSVIGEEDGGLGAYATLERGHRADACIIGEPTNGAVVSAAAGALTFRLEIEGRAAHGSTRYEGVSAIEALWPVHRAMVELEADRQHDPDPLMAGYPIPYPLSIGIVRSGEWASSVPDLLVAEGRYGVRLDEDPAMARAELEERVAAACAADLWLADHPVRVSWPGGQYASGRLPTGHPLLGIVQGAVADVTGTGPPTERGGPYGSDLRLYAARGVPTLMLGPGDVRFAHATGERVPVAEMVSTAEALVLTAMRLCGVR